MSQHTLGRLDVVGPSPERQIRGVKTALKPRPAQRERPTEPARAAAVTRPPTADPAAGAERPATAAPVRLRGLLEPNDLAVPEAFGPAAPTTTRPAKPPVTPAATPPAPLPTAGPAATEVPRTPEPTAALPALPTQPPTAEPKTARPAATPPATASPTPPVHDDRRRRNGVLLLLVVVAAAGVFGLVVLVMNTLNSTPLADLDQGPSIVGERATDEPSAPPPQTSAPSDVAPSTDASSPGASSAGVPGGLPPADGLSVAIAVVSANQIEVVETLRWPDGGPAAIELELPANAATAGGLAINPALSIESLQVSIDGTPVMPTPRTGTSNAWVLTPPSGAAPRSMVVRYLLDGAIVRSVPATPGRALAVLTPISTGAADGLPITIAIAAANVLNVYCPGASSQSAILCGRLEGDQWTVTPPPGGPLVVAQLDLPDPL